MPERLHEVGDVEFIGAAGAGALLGGKPDFFLRNGGKRIEVSKLAGTGDQFADVRF